MEVGKTVFPDKLSYQIMLAPVIAILFKVAFSVLQKLWFWFPVGTGVFWIVTKTGTLTLSQPFIVCEA